MPVEVSVRELRNDTAAVVERVEAGERVVLTVNRRAVADIVPHVEPRPSWVPAASLRAIVRESGADAGLLADLADVRGALVE
jgi:prevent-host-death family protein